jgi:hypothetical protein
LEQFADGIATDTDLAAVRLVFAPFAGRRIFRQDELVVFRVIQRVLATLDSPDTFSITWDKNQPERTASTIRDIFGNPFRPASLDPSWLTSTVLALAEGIYQDRAFHRMPVLADALQDAGCENLDILDHCRCDRSHVRGCWVVDLLTGRS